MSETPYRIVEIKVADPIYERASECASVQGRKAESLFEELVAHEFAGEKIERIDAQEDAR